MRYLFDTNLWIQILKQKAPEARRRVDLNPMDTFVTCSIVQAELWHGACKYDIPARRRLQVETALSPYESLPFDALAADYYATIRHDLELRGEIIGPNDLKIAAICLAHDLTLVTGNISEFSRVRGLRVENWSAPAT
jgi:tRNA(fMet)-specific endonuclease VapC